MGLTVGLAAWSWGEEGGFRHPCGVLLSHRSEALKGPELSGPSPRPVLPVLLSPMNKMPSWLVP